MIRRTRFLSVLALLSVSILSVGCGEDQSEASQKNGATIPAKPQITELPGVDQSRLTAAEKRMWVDLVNTQLSPCGEPVTVAECVQSGGACKQCLPAAKYMSRLVSDGLEKSDIAEYARLRYNKDAALNLPVDGAAIKGEPMAPVTIVEFADFQCGHCATAQPYLRQAVAEFPGKVKVVFLNFIVTGAPASMYAALAGVAAQKQGKFWELADLMFTNQRTLTEASIQGYAKELGLDMERFMRDYNDPAAVERIKADMELGQKIGLDSTPTILINNRRFKPPEHRLETLGQYIREELDAM